MFKSFFGSVKLKFKKMFGKSSLKSSKKSPENGNNSSENRKNFRREVEDLFFPIDLTCNVCGREIFGGKYFCDDCENSLPRLSSGAVCEHCGRKVPYNVERCDSCSGRDTYFDKAVSLFDYEEPISSIITSLKYGGKRYFSRVFAEDLCNVYVKSFLNCDFALFVPMVAEREKFRGYNQAQLIAEEFSRFSGVPVEYDIIYKRHETERQAMLSFADRQKNLRGSFGVKNRKKLVGKRVLLIDDVMTTGATTEEICFLLKKYGATFVAVLTIASVQKRKY